MSDRYQWAVTLLWLVALCAGVLGKAALSWLLFAAWALGVNCGRILERAGK